VLIIDNILVSDEVIEKKFVCDLSKCKGGCCEDGDAGAPLDKSELDLVVQYYETIKPFLSEASVQEIEKKGMYTYDREFGWVTPTLPSDREVCVYGIREADGMIKCAFEKAFYAGLIPWKKPVSCHLYPVIANKGKRGAHDTMNYEPREKLCNPACALGKKLEVPVYEFLKEPIIRKYGESFYEALDQAAKFQQPQPGEKVKHTV
jgi:hypothetical protein